MKATNLLTRKEVADFFKVKIVTVRNWQHIGKIKPYCYINNRPRYRLNDLQHLLSFKKTDKTQSTYGSK